MVAVAVDVKSLTAPRGGAAEPPGVAGAADANGENSSHGQRPENDHTPDDRSILDTRDIHLPEATWHQIERAERLMEVGCGFGHLLALLAERCRGFVCGTDRDAALLENLRQQYPALAVFAADSQEAVPIAAQSMDLIVSTDMLEHLPCPERHLAEMRRILRPGGIYLIKTPNAYFDTLYWLLNQTMKRLRGRGAQALWRWPQAVREAHRYIRQPGMHCSTQTPASLRRLLCRNGFRCLQLVKQPPSTTQCEKLAKLPAGARHLLMPLVRLLPVLPHALQWSVVGVFMKEEDLRIAP